MTPPPKVEIVINEETKEWALCNFPAFHQWAYNVYPFYRMNDNELRKTGVDEVGMLQSQLASALTNLHGMTEALTMHLKATRGVAPAGEPSQPHG